MLTGIAKTQLRNYLNAEYPGRVPDIYVKFKITLLDLKCLRPPYQEKNTTLGTYMYE